MDPSYSSVSTLEPAASSICNWPSATSLDPAVSSYIEAHVAAGQRTLKRIRVMVCVTLLATGFLSSVFLTLSHVQFLKHADLDTEPAIDRFSGSIFGFVFNFRLFVISLAPLADSIRLTRYVLMIDAIFILSDGFVYLWSVSYELSYRIVMLVQNILFCCGAYWAARPSNPAFAQARMWKIISTYFIVDLIGTLNAFNCKLLGIERCGWWMVSDVLAMYAALNVRLRQLVQVKLGRIFVARGANAAAAGIAALVGNCSAKEVLAIAKARFRCIPLCDVTREDIQTNAPDVALFCKTLPGVLGRCDAFISHSWSDDPVSKWNALQRWREEFCAAHAREPVIWFDKYCIEQRNIDADLRALPIFLRGCSRLVILCGTSFLSRLWCILELFTFIHIGGSIDDVELQFVLRPDSEEEELRSIRLAFDSFDARLCECYRNEDKERILAALNTAFGSIDEFNDVVRGIVATIGDCAVESD